MNSLKKWISILTLSAIATSPMNDLDAREYCTDTGGAAYEAAYQSCCLTPALVFALVAIAGIIAVGVHNRSHSAHDHSADSD